MLTEVMTMLKRMMNFWLYSGPIWRPPISDKHLSVTLRNSGTSRNWEGEHAPDQHVSRVNENEERDSRGR